LIEDAEYRYVESRIKYSRNVMAACAAYAVAIMLVLYYLRPSGAHLLLITPPSLVMGAWYGTYSAAYEYYSGRKKDMDLARRLKEAKEWAEYEAKTMDRR